jgi:hypothetical protein
MALIPEESRLKLLGWRCQVCERQNYLPVPPGTETGKALRVVCRKCDSAGREILLDSNVISGRRQRPRPALGGLGKTRSPDAG